MAELATQVERDEIGNVEMNNFTRITPRPVMANWLRLILVSMAVLGAVQTLSSVGLAQDSVESAREVLSRRSFPWYDAENDSTRPMEFGNRPEPESANRELVPDRIIRPNRNFGGGGLGAGGGALGSGLSMVAWILLGIVIAVLLAALVWAFFRLESNRRKGSGTASKRSVEESIRQLPFSVDRKPGNLKDQAEAAYKNGDYRQAIILLYSHLLVSLDQRHLLHLQKGKTNRQYLRELGSRRSLAQYFENVMVPFESVFFGDHELSRPEFESCWQSLPRFEQEINSEEHHDRPRLAVGTAMIVLFALMVSGCDRPQRLVTEYGAVSGQEGGVSVNGTTVLFEMFRERGHHVKRASKISPRIHRYDTIIWAPDHHGCPSEEAIEALENWLYEGFERTLIYVGRDYDAELDYLKYLEQNSAQDQRNEITRQLAESMLRQDQRRMARRGDEDFTCEWFDIEEGERKKASRLSGPLGLDIDATQATVERSSHLELNETFLDGYSEEAKPLLRADGTDFVTEVLVGSDYGFENRIIFVDNGSFLLNYALVNRENRKMAGALIDLVPEDSGVIFLESGPGGIRVSDSDYNDHNSWAWIGKPPLKYIVPHFLLWALLYCFVIFPIFGRPEKWSRKTLDDESTADHTQAPMIAGANASFRDHIVAMGKLLQRSGRRTDAIKKIEKYQSARSE